MARVPPTSCEGSKATASAPDLCKPRLIPSRLADGDGLSHVERVRSNSMKLSPSSGTLNVIVADIFLFGFGLIVGAGSLQDDPFGQRVLLFIGMAASVAQLLFTSAAVQTSIVASKPFSVCIPVTALRVMLWLCGVFAGRGVVWLAHGRELLQGVAEAPNVHAELHNSTFSGVPDAHTLSKYDPLTPKVGTEISTRQFNSDDSYLTLPFFEAAYDTLWARQNSLYVAMMGGCIFTICASIAMCAVVVLAKWEYQARWVVLRETLVRWHTMLECSGSGLEQRGVRMPENVTLVPERRRYGVGDADRERSSTSPLELR